MKSVSLVEFWQGHGKKECYAIKMHRAGLGPRTVDLGYGPRVTEEAAAEYIAALSDPKSKVARAMAERARKRSERSKLAGAAAVASPHFRGRGRK